MNQHDQMRALIDAAEEDSKNYEDDPRPDVRCDVMNAFFRGANWQKKQALAAEPDKLEVRKILVSAHNAFVALSGLTQNSTALHVIKEQSRQLKVALAKHGGST